MSNTTALYRRKIGNAEDLQAVVRTMKALAATSIGQYENSVRALTPYYRTVELGLGVCLRASDYVTPPIGRKESDESTMTAAIVFGSDQGLVGQFNDVVSQSVVKALADLPGTALVWVVGERLHAQLEDAGIKVTGLYTVPGSVKGIAPLVTRIQLDSDEVLSRQRDTNLYLFYNSPLSGSSYKPVKQRLLPFDSGWQQQMMKVTWPTSALPEVLVDTSKTLRALIREYLFISLYRACAESLASENASRLSAMERADKNIEETLENLRVKFNRLRQRSIDEELFDVTAGFEALVN